MKRALSFFMPGGLLFVAAFIVVHMGELSASLPAIMNIYPYVVFAAAVLLGWRFNRSSLVFAAISLAIADRSLLLFAGNFPSSGMHEGIVFNAVSVLLPVNLAVLCLMKERGTFTIHGIVRMVLIALQPLVIAVFIKIDPARLLFYLRYAVVDWKIPAHVPFYSQPFLPSSLRFLLSVSGLSGTGGQKRADSSGCLLQFLSVSPPWSPVPCQSFISRQRGLSCSYPS